MTPDLNQLFRTSEGDNLVPALEDMIKTASTTNIERLQVSESLRNTARNVIPIRPFMVNRLSLAIQATQGGSKAVLIEAIKSIRKFDNKMIRIRRDYQTHGRILQILSLLAIPAGE